MKRNKVQRATGLLVRSMQQADLPIADLSDALARMARTLNDPAADADELRAEIGRNIAVCIESLQSYDRLMQQLARARDILTAIAPGDAPEAVTNGSTHSGRIEGTVELF